MRGFRMPADLQAKLDAWIERQPDPKPSRSEAIRRLLERALTERLR
jgi:metal-responsive CopG/Arc/MetJ family transcriptional regulator